MRVLIVNTSERTGGAAIAANRLMEALKNNGVKVTMLVRDKQTPQITVSATGAKWLMAIRFLWERLVIWAATGFNKKDIWQVDIANVGTDITKTDEFKKADVIHLHWVNQGFLSMKGLKKILNSGKRVVITLHDMWYFTGICHYVGECDRFKSQCHDCPLLKKKVLGMDLAKKVFKKKDLIYDNPKLSFVGCSQWMRQEAANAALMRRQKVVSIPNTINTKLFCPADKKNARKRMGLPADGKLILFGSQRITDERKGFAFLAEACRFLQTEYPVLAGQITVVVVGSNSSEVKSHVPFNVVAVDYVSDERDMVALYNAVDIYVTPSLQDNLPNTIMEAMACGTPCVGFNVGGIPEMIEHQHTGYVARYKDAEDFAKGMVWTLDEQNYQRLSTQSREKVKRDYDESHVARLYTEVYEGRR